MKTEIPVLLTIPRLLSTEEAEAIHGEAILSLFVPLRDIAESRWVRDANGWGVTLPNGSIGLGATPHAALNAAVGITPGA